MSSPTTTTPEPQPDPGRAPAGPAAGRHPAVPALASALMLWVAFPPAEWAPLAWVALVPLFTLVRSPRRARSVYAGAWLGGLAFWLLAINWVRTIDASAFLAWLVMATLLAFEWPIALLIARLGVRRLGLPLMLAAPASWVAVEYVRAHILSGFPWYYLAHTQYRMLPLIQVSDLAGSLGVSFLLAAANACWVDLLTLPLFRPAAGGPRLARAQAVRLGVLGLAVGASLGYGAYRLGTAEFRPGPRLALLQSDYIQRYEMRMTAEQILTGMANLVARAEREEPRPDLIVWPETAYPYGFVRFDPDLSDDRLVELFPIASERRGAELDWPRRREDISRDLHGWVDRIGISMLIGASTDDFGAGGFTRSNAAILLKPGDPSERTYAKIQLVPFGEYIPLIDVMPWLTVLTPYRGAGIPNLKPGDTPTWLDLGPHRIAPLICFEDTVPQLVRRFFAEVPDGRHPDLLLNLTNDGWFHDTSEQEMHLAVSVFRSIENRAPLARAVNTGITALVDGDGRIVASLPKRTEGVLSVVVPLDDRIGLYSSVGDWLGRACLALALGLWPLSTIVARRKPRVA